jgi:HlyD family secretion protein
MRSAALVLLAALAGCGSKSALDQPGWRQGVVEHDDRDLCFELAGTVKTVAVDRGAEVTAGQEMARIDDTLERATQEAREADAREAEAALALLRAGTRAQELAILRAQDAAAATALEVARTDLDRARAVEERDALSRSAFDAARDRASHAESDRATAAQRLSEGIEGPRPEELASAVAHLEAARAAAALERERVGLCVIRSPITGRVVTKDLDPGEAALPGRPVLTVADAKHPYIDVFVPEDELAGLAIGGQAEARVDGDDRSYRAAIEDIGRQLEYTPRYLFSRGDRPNLMMRVRVRVDDPDERLHAGVPAAVHFTR